METDEIIGLSSHDAARPRPAPSGFEGNSLDDAVRDLITTYHSLNPSQITVLDTEPSPLEFMRHVSQNRPFVIRKGASTWPALQKWNIPYLKRLMANQNVNVAMTPYGNADSILHIPIPSGKEGTSEKDGNIEKESILFIKPHETSEPFTSVIDAISTQELHGRHPNKNQPSSNGSPIRYAQTQNDNLRAEYTPLFTDVPTSIPFARIALQSAPDAINFWLGNSFSTTALHKDNYENIYVQVLGKKHFVLLPPVAAPCVNERAVLSATYVPREDSREGHEDGQERLVLVPSIDSPGEPVYTPFCTWDPDKPMENATRFSELAEPVRLTLEEGDMLYLPALWYHKVSQSCNDEGVCCAVNYWYDLEFAGGFWSMANFVRGVGLLSTDSGKENNEEKRA